MRQGPRCDKVGDMSSLNAELGDLALAIAREAADLASSGQGDVRVEATKSSPLDLVTQMDRACEALIRDRLAQARPGDGFLGEESGEARSAIPGAVRWIVDPIDGTVNYFYGHPNWAVSIAAERDGQTLAGAVVAPALGEEYLAIAGVGSFRVDDGQRRRLRCSTQEDLSMALVATGFGYRRERRIEQARVLAELIPDIRDIRRGGGAAIDLCWVGSGRVDAYYERGLNPWDRAAAGLVASEAGAVVGGLRGQESSQSMTLAGPSKLFEQLEARLVDLAADREEMD